jgi:4a-hydroxytetrahydrobiopterin dehydratase
MSSLAEKQCVPCRGGTPPLPPAEASELLRQLDSQWTLIQSEGDRADGVGLRLERMYRFKNFREALDFVDRDGATAEEQGHHPDVCLSWGRVRLTIWTHKINGLTESDFIFAAKSDAAYKQELFSDAEAREDRVN